MNNGFFDIGLDDEIVSLFIHKPYNFKLDTTKEEERENNYRKIEEEINYKFKKIIGTKQVHSNVVKVLNEENINDDFENVDGLITNLKGVALVTYLADCQGILFYDTKNKVIGNIHSGWKGTLTRISTNAINIMKSNFNSNPEDIKVYISPSIHKCCFEVGEELKKSFEKEFTDIDLSDLIIKGDFMDEQKYFIDTVELNKRVLINLGIKKENISSSELCSMCNSEFIHSYRKDRPNDGRNNTLIEIKNN